MEFAGSLLLTAPSSLRLLFLQLFETLSLLALLDLDHSLARHLRDVAIPLVLQDDVAADLAVLGHTLHQEVPRVFLVP